MRAARPQHLARLSTLALLLVNGAGFAQAQTRNEALPRAKAAMVEFENSPFPYRGDIPDKNVPFLDAVDGDRHGHTSPRGGVYWEEKTYSDRHVLLAIPRGFDPRKPSLIVLYFHGNSAKLGRDVRDRQQLPRQVAESGLNAVLVAPQLALDAHDSSSGRFWEPGFFARFLDEAAEKLAALYGRDDARTVFANAPVVMVAYSGGYQPAAWSIYGGGASARVRGMILLDALYAETDKFAAWLAAKPAAFFVSAYTRLTRGENDALQKTLGEQKLDFKTSLPPKLADGSIAFISNGDDVVHDDFVTQAWIPDPVKAMLARVPGFSKFAPLPKAVPLPPPRPQ